MTATVPSSTASVATDRPQRYGKQLVSHLTRRVTGAWDDTSSSGVVDFGAGRAGLSCTPHSLELALTCPPDELDHLEDVLGRHLVRFGARDELTVRWVRSDGTPGTEQRKNED